jgi:hypothetical protein
MQSDISLCSCRCKSWLCILVARDRDPEKLYGWEMDRDYLFAIQKVRKLQPPKGKNAWAADFQSFMLIRFPCVTLVNIHKSATKARRRTREAGPILAFPLCAMGSITALPASVRFLFPVCFDGRMQEP